MSDDAIGTPVTPPAESSRTGMTGAISPEDTSPSCPTVDVTILREEYFHIQNAIESFDAKALTIKAWSVTLSMAGVGAAYFQGKPVVLLLAALSAFLFWMIEALWKTFQFANYKRVYEIERYFAGQTESIATPRIAHSWSESWHAGGMTRLFRIMAWPHVFLPHAVVFVGGVLLYFIHLFWGGM